MKPLSKLFKADDKFNGILITACCYCCFLLLARAKITNTVTLFFLVWNLVLAVVPYLLMLYLKKSGTAFESGLKKFAALCLWLLFLPNSFYIITDFIHLSRSTGGLIWLDLLIVSSFALLGFCFGIASLLEFESIMKYSLGKKISAMMIPFICFLCGFGIYLGRVLRYNSWDVIRDPVALASDLAKLAPTLNVVLFSVHFGVFIYAFYAISKFLKNN